MLGSVLNQRFHLDSILRRGRSGVAYLATDEASGELFAVKVFARDIGMEGPAGHAYRARLRHLGGLNHAHVIVAATAGREAGQWYEAAPYFPGESAEGELGRSGLAAGEGIEVLRQLAEGLAALHEAGTVHGGILPRRILVSRVDGVHAVLLDPARYLLTEGQAISAADAAFSAPEQDPRHELPVDCRADLYALGALALTILMGASGTTASPSRPGARARPQQLSREAQTAAAGRLREAQTAAHAQWAGIEADRARSAPEVPPDLRPILGRLVAVNPEHRYASATDLLADLRSIGHAPAAAQPDRQAPPLLLRGTPAELETPRKAIQERFGRASSGKGGAVVLQGWDGFGLDRVLRAGIPDLEASGALLLRARASEGCPSPPLSAVRQWFSDFQRQLDLLPVSHGDAIRIRLEPVLSRLPSGLDTAIPELTPLNPAARPPPTGCTLSPYLLERHRQVMLARACEALVALGEPSHPLVLWIANLGAIDADSLQVLRLLLHRIQDEPILVIAGFHPRPAGGGNAVESLLGAPALRSGVVRSTLPLLTQQQTERQTRKLLGCPEGGNEAAAVAVRELAERLYLVWLGVPWAQEQTLRLLVEEGVLAPEGAPLPGSAPAWTVARPLKDWEAPGSLAGLVHRRLAFLPAELRGCLVAAAVLDAPFGEQAVAALCDEQPFESVCAYLERLVALGWLIRQCSGYAFSEPLVQRTLYESLDDTRRRALHVAASETAAGWLAAGHLFQAGDPDRSWSLAKAGMEAEDWPACAATMLAPLSRVLPALPEPERTESAQRLAQAALALGQPELAQHLLASHPGNSAGTQARAALLRAYTLDAGDAVPWVVRALEWMGQPLPPGALSAVIGKATADRGRHASPATAHGFTDALPLPSAGQSERLSLMEAAAELMQDIEPEIASVLEARILEEAATCEAPAFRLRALLRLGAQSGLPNGTYFLQARNAIEREELSHLAPGYHLAVGIAALGELDLAAAAEALAKAALGYRSAGDPIGLAETALSQWELAWLTGPVQRMERSALDLQWAAGAVGSAAHALFARAARVETDAIAGRCTAGVALDELARLVSAAPDTAGPVGWKPLAAHALQLALVLRAGPDEGDVASLASDSAQHSGGPSDATLLLAVAEWRLAQTALGDPQDEQQTRLTHDALARAARAASRRRIHQAHLALLDSMSACVQVGFEAALARLEDALVAAEVQGARFLLAHLWWRLAEGARRIGDARWMTWAGKALTECDALGAHALTNRVREWIEGAPARLTDPTPDAGRASVRKEGPAARSRAAASPDSCAEEIVSDGTVGIVSGRIRGLARLAVPDDWRRVLDRYYERLEFALSLHRMTLVARGKAGWCAYSATGALSAFWATHTLRPLVSECFEEIAGEAADEPPLLRTGIGLHAAMLFAPRTELFAPRGGYIAPRASARLARQPRSAALPAPRDNRSAEVPAEAEREPAILAGDALPQAERLADLSAFLRAGPILSPEMTDCLPPSWKERLRPLGPWTVGTGAGPRELFAFAGTPGAGTTGPGSAGLDLWNRALTAYRSRDWRTAIAALKTFLAGHPTDRLGRLLLRHSQRRYTERPRIPGTML